MRELKRKYILILFLVLVALIVIITVLFPASLMPGELTESHSEIQCDDCHTPWEGAQDLKCTGCHDDQNIHWHNNSVFENDCQSCHTLHKEDAQSNGLDCLKCHSDVHDDQGYSNGDCLTCHTSSGIVLLDYTHKDPYVQRIMEKDDHKDGEDCYLCHDTKKFDEYNCLSANCHGTNKYDEEHDEEAEDWRSRDCFEYGCHSRTVSEDTDENDGFPAPEITEDDKENALCLIFIIILALVLLIIGYIFLRRAMEK